MTHDDILLALKALVPSTWDVCEAPSARHFEAWAIPDNNWEEWAIAISHSENWHKSGHAVKGKWHASVTPLGEKEDDEESFWCETPEEALEFVRKSLPELKATINQWRDECESQDPLIPDRVRLSDEILHAIVPEHPVVLTVLEPGHRQDDVSRANLRSRDDS